MSKVILIYLLNSFSSSSQISDYNIILYIGIFIGNHSINFITLMPKAKIYPETQNPKNKKDKENNSNGSFIKMNASFVPEISSYLLIYFDTCEYCNT